MDIRGKPSRLLAVLLALLPSPTIEQKATATVEPDDPTPALTSPLIDWPAEAIE